LFGCEKDIAAGVVQRRRQGPETEIRAVMEAARLDVLKAEAGKGGLDPFWIVRGR